VSASISKPVAGRAYSARAKLIAFFLVFALILGGGGSPNPATELLLEIAFSVSAAIWLWLPSEQASGTGRTDRLVLVLIAIPLAIPIIQLVPLPSSIWTALPARQDEFAALSLVGEENSWHPISLSWTRTLAALLAILPAIGCAYAVARLDLRGRRLVIATIGAMALVSAMFGVLQLFAGSRGINLYRQFHAGWITGFQANRNAEADVLLIGFLALATLAAPYVSDRAKKIPMMLDRRAVLALMLATTFFLLAATMMTGSRAGTALIAAAVVVALGILTVSHAPSERPRRTPLVVGTVLVLVVGLAVGFLAYSGHTSLGRLAERFTDAQDNRLPIWQDTWFALGQYWPVGFGLGGFEPAMLPAERLEFLDTAIPNRAHNDFLEIGLEAGILGYAMLAAAALVCFTMAYRSWQRQAKFRSQILFAAGVLIIITLHSLVDYPIVGLILLQHQPHAADIFLGMAPVALGVEIAEEQLVLAA
jgi:O-antigen ligase